MNEYVEILASYGTRGCMEIISRSQAKAAGLKFYFTGKPCKNGHIAERYAAGRCVLCTRQWANAGYYRDHEQQKSAARERRRIEYRRNPGREVAKSVAYRKRNLAKVQARLRVWQSERLKNDPIYKIKARLRSRLSKAVTRGKAGSAVRDLGCTVAQLKQWLEDQFVLGMTWDNYGPVWHIDHKEPLVSFDLTDPVQFKAACHYTNLQPLFASDNHCKGPRYRPSTYSHLPRRRRSGPRRPV
jgi:hypothetical protein